MSQTRLESRHLERFAALTEDQVRMVVASAGRLWTHDTPGHPPAPLPTVEPRLGEDAFHYCQALGLDMALTILSLASEPTAIARGAVEALHGKPILPWASSVEEAAGKPQEAGGPNGGSKRALVDDRVVVSVAPNPRKPDSEAGRAYVHWRAGDTVQACLDRGLTRRSVRRDVRHGHVVLR